jgi:outer membrane protein OmpA-like peptidoglycan-associated protein
LKPINLGYPINSPADDIYFIPDSLNQTSYLASNRIGTVGQEDIFVVKLHEKVLVKGMVTDIRTGKPLAGFSMSTVAQRKPERQAGLTIAEDGTYDFQLMSNYSYNVQIKNEEGEIILQDVLEVPPAYESHTQLIKDYQLKVSSEELAVQKQWLRIENRNLLKIKYMPTDSIFFAGKVSSIAGNIPEARVLIRKEESGDILYETTTNDQGNYIFGFIPESKTDYIIEIHKAGYLPNHIAILYTDELDTRGSGLDSASYSLNAIDVITKLIEVKAGARQVIGGVYFEFKSADLFPESFIVLDQLADYLQADPDITIEVGGFTDDAGTEQENKLLSLRRAQSVIYYLRSKGIPAQKLKAAGYSKNNPIVSNASAINGRDVNRRVEIKILSR